jgi:hypothetical protein
MHPRVDALGVVAFLLCAAGAASAQDVQKNVPYVCNGEKIVIDSCNMRDLSDTSTCMVGHPDTILPNGLMKYTTETRGSLKKLLPTCKQPTAEQVNRAKAFEKKQNDLYEANVQKANDENDAIEARAQAQIQSLANGKKPATPEERAVNRCLTAGRLPASCTGNALLGAFSDMLTSATSMFGIKDPRDPVAGSEAASVNAGPNMAGVFQGAGGWRLDFTDAGVLVNCSDLSPDERHYKLDFKGDRVTLAIDVTPKPLVLTVRNDGTIVGPGPVTFDGVMASGYKSDVDPNAASGYKDQYGMSLSNQQVKTGSTPTYDSMGNRTYSPTVQDTGHTVFAHKRVTCPAQNLSSKGASVGMQTMQLDMLKTMFGGDKGPPTPPGIRMHGIYASASTGFSVQFFPESVILGCGPDAARAYPYQVAAEGAGAVIHVSAPDHPLTLKMQADGSLEPSEGGAYQVHGRRLLGQNDNGDLTFAPMEQSCGLSALAPSKTIPASGGAAATITASGGRGSAAGGGSASATLSTPNAPLGNATLSIVSGFPAQPGVANPLAGRPYLLLRDTYGGILAKIGIVVPAGTSPYKYVATLCGNKSPDCQKATDAVKAAVVSAARADANGGGTFPGVPPGTYYLMISTRYNNQPMIWGQAVQLNAGANSQTLDARNATPVN